jgi:hypothetical protein
MLQQTSATAARSAQPSVHRMQAGAANLAVCGEARALQPRDALDPQPAVLLALQQHLQWLAVRVLCEQNSGITNAAAAQCCMI